MFDNHLYGALAEYLRAPLLLCCVCIGVVQDCGNVCSTVTRYGFCVPSGLLISYVVQCQKHTPIHMLYIWSPLQFVFLLWPMIILLPVVFLLYPSPTPFNDKYLLLHPDGSESVSGLFKTEKKCFHTEVVKRCLFVCDGWRKNSFNY